MNNLHWKQEWFPGTNPYVLWEATWSDAGVFALAPVGAISITGVAHASGNLGYALTSTHNITQVGRVNLVGSVTLPPAVFGYITFPFDIEGPPLSISTIPGVLGITGALQYTVDVTQAWNFNQVGAFTAQGLLTISGGIEYTLRPDEPFDISQVGGVALNGVVKVLGQLQALRSFELLTQPVAINGLLVFLDGALDFPFPSIINVLQVGEITLAGALTFGSTTFRFDSFTEGLPRGWYVDGPILETVPNPNYGTAYGNAFFRRWTWKGYDPAGTMVAASGSEQDCFAQTLAVCQSRHEDWRVLAR